MKKLTKIALAMILCITFMAQSALAAGISLKDSGTTHQSLPTGSNGNPSTVSNFIRLAFVNTSPHTLNINLFNTKSDFYFQHWLNENGNCVGTSQSISIPAGKTYIAEMKLKTPMFHKNFAFNYTSEVSTSDGRHSRHEARFIYEKKSSYSTGSKLADGWNANFSSGNLSLSPCYYNSSVTVTTSDTIAKMVTEWFGIKSSSKIYTKAMKALADQIVKLSKIPGTKETYTNFTVCFGEIKNSQLVTSHADDSLKATGSSSGSHSVSHSTIKTVRVK